MNSLRHRTILYAITTTVALSTISIALYLLTRHHLATVHYSYLLEKASLTAQKNYERDELPTCSYDTLIHSYARLLPSATEVTVDSLAPHATDTLLHYMGNKALQQLLAHGAAPFRYRGIAGAAIYYPDNEGSFYVLVYATNSEGKRLAHLIFGIAATLLLILLSILAMMTRWRAAYERESLFVSNASHQLNNPLTALQGECELALLHDRSATDYRDALLRIQTQTEQMEHTLHSMLLLARQHPHKMKHAPVDLYDVCTAVAAHYPRTIVTGHSCIVPTNEELLRQALDNLVSNACKYSSGSVHINIKASRRWAIEVCDNGIGIPSDELRLIFNPFHRARNARDMQGCGIGLAIASRVATLIGAKIKVSSPKGGGTIFKIEKSCFFL